MAAKRSRCNPRFCTQSGEERTASAELGARLASVAERQRSKGKTMISECRRRQGNVWRRFPATGLALGATMILAFISQAYAEEGIVLAPPAANLDQVRNGAAGSPVDPGDWVNGNLGEQQAHYIEGYSVPYRAVLTDMPLATEVRLILGYDIKHSDKHALDFLTHFNRIDDPEHQTVFGHPPETIDPLIGVTGVSATVTTSPSSKSAAGSKVAVLVGPS